MENMDGISLIGIARIDGNTGSFLSQTGFKNIQKLGVGNYLVTLDRCFGENEFSATATGSANSIFSIGWDSPGVLIVLCSSPASAPLDTQFSIMVGIASRIR